LRLNVYLQKAGVGSRREAERLVAEGRVRINGSTAVATQPVGVGDEVYVDGKRVLADDAPLPRLFMLHKPLDVLVTQRDPQGRRTVYDLPALKNPKLPRLMYVGRLDVNSEGLLLLSSDGPLAQALMSPANALARVYRVRVKGRLNEQALRKLASGVTIEGIRYRGAEVSVEHVPEGKANAWYRVTLREGKNREVRKLLEHFGCVVNRLIRVSYGSFELGVLPSGAIEEVPSVQVAELMRDLGTKQGTSPAATPRPLQRRG
jgi:23S rRNA pseudouridine2605 synthase